LRGCWKTATLALSLSACLASYPLRFALARRTRGAATDAGRALWLHRCCRMVLARLGFEMRVIGTPPMRGLVVSNHLSYLDILFYGAAYPCVFVAKAEVRRWPMLGTLAALGGTVFIDRSSAASAAKAAARVQELLAAGVPVLVFPEGTSTDGAAVLRFYPSLFEPAVRAGAPVTAAAIGYSACGQATERDLCYYGDISFAPHLLQTLRLRGIRATLRFAPAGVVYENRKLAAALAREAVVELRDAGVGLEAD